MLPWSGILRSSLIALAFNLIQAHYSFPSTMMMSTKIKQINRNYSVLILHSRRAWFKLMLSCWITGYAYRDNIRIYLRFLMTFVVWKILCAMMMFSSWRSLSLAWDTSTFVTWRKSLHVCNVLMRECAILHEVITPWRMYRRRESNTLFGEIMV